MLHCNILQSKQYNGQSCLDACKQTFASLHRTCYCKTTCCIYCDHLHCIDPWEKPAPDSVAKPGTSKLPPLHYFNLLTLEMHWKLTDKRWHLQCVTFCNLIFKVTEEKWGSWSLDGIEHKNIYQRRNFLNIAILFCCFHIGVALLYLRVVFKKGEHLVSWVWVHCKFLLYKFNSRKVTTRKLEGMGGRGDEYVGFACFSFASLL